MEFYLKAFKNKEIKSLFRGAIQSEYLKNATKLFTGTALAQVISVAASPVLSRLYTPADFGTFALYNSTLSILLIFCTGRYDVAIVSAKSRTGSINLVSLSFIILGVLTFLISLLLVALHNWIAGLIEHPELSQVLYLIPVSFLFMGSYQILSYWSNREKNYGYLASSKIVQNVSNISVAIYAGLFLSLGVGLVWGQLVGALMALTVVAYKSGSILKELKRFTTKKNLKQCAIEHADFPKYSLPTSFLDTFTTQLPVYLISFLFTEALAGHFSFAFRILNLPISLIGVSIGQVFYQKLTEVHHSRQGSLKLILKMWGLLFMIGIVPFTILLFFGNELFTLFFGAEWEEAGKIASILSIPLLFVFCSSPTSTAFIVYGIQKFSLMFGIMFILLRPLAFYIGYLYNDVFLSLILWGVTDVILIILFNIILLKKASGYNKHV
ncbi:oligosaccharide flippase family protein [Pontibacter anaerobius]|uniref:Oligosaccharide flippase family protein n=1 Tax=Pontibacter anaerobius TaxID=2993940 RepID=A0ABT3RJ87_9BACT|nr:oligosaccharide flippase family protein [Pontibacter anaerobius]MCX2741558.1 oligosaccharide flippase family protein [Pontibacter anaerobius]